MKKLSEISRKDLQINGVYKITNIKNNKFYIGSCSSKTFLYDRLKHHEQDLLKNRHCNKYLQRSFNKYSINDFYYEIIEICNPEECLLKEQYWIDLLNPHYNLCKNTGSSFGRECTPETRQKISNSNKLKWKDPLFIEEMRIKTLNKKPRIKKVKIKKEFHGGCKKVMNLDTGIVYNSVMEASNELKTTYTYLIAMLNGKRKLSRNIKYVE